VIVFLRAIGLLNVAVWFGAVIFFTVGVAPALFSPEVKALLQQSYPILSGRLAMVVVSKYFLLHYWCGTVALLHQLAERFYLSKPLQRLTFGVLIGVCCLSLLNGLWLQSNLRKLHQVEYGRSDIYGPQQKAQASHAFRVWHGVSFGLNLLVMGGLGVYLWRLANPGNGPRFVPAAAKFRG
jgi:uncharacterized protein DUF4149